MAKKRVYNCLKRAKSWAHNCNVLEAHHSYGNGAQVNTDRVAVAVAQLMREAYNAGLEAGYTERNKTAAQANIVEV